MITYWWILWNFGFHDKRLQLSHCIFRQRPVVILWERWSLLPVNGRRDCICRAWRHRVSSVCSHITIHLGWDIHGTVWTVMRNFYAGIYGSPFRGHLHEVGVISWQRFGVSSSLSCHDQVVEMWKTGLARCLKRIKVVLFVSAGERDDRSLNTWTTRAWS
jgi:hypothetical protein